MTGRNIKLRIVLTFATMLAIAMLLQSLVIVFLDLRSAVQEDIHWLKLYLKRNIPAKYSIASVEDIKNIFNIAMVDAESASPFSCISVEIDKRSITGQKACRYSEQMQSLADAVTERDTERIRFAGTGWYSLFSMHEVVLIAVPLVTTGGQFVGTLTAERSLLPIYSCFKRDAEIILSYLAVNVLLFAVLFFVRIQNLFFRPLDRLVKKAENYQQGEQHFALVSDDDSPFRKLSSRLNVLITRIENDNRTLRRHVLDLERANTELKLKNDLVLRSEKLASVGRLSAGLAHEIGNPLSIIQGYVELLGQDDLTAEEKQRFSQNIQQELDRIKRLIRQLLDFSGPAKLAAEPVSMHGLIQDVLGFISLEKSSKKCSIKPELLAGEDTVVANRDALRQVLINCLLNAVDATEVNDTNERNIQILTAVEENSSAQPQFILRIQDNGTGIAEEQLKQVFDPFYTTKEVGRGTGLGLFVCHSIIETIGGTISLDNVLPHGVEVKIILPLQKKSLT